MNFTEQEHVAARLDGFDPEELGALKHRLRLLDPFMVDDDVQEIAIDEPGGAWLWKSGHWSYVEVRDLDFAYLATLGRNLANFTKKHSTASTRLCRGICR